MNKNKQIITITFVVVSVYMIYLSSCGWDDPCYRNFGVHTTNAITIDRAELSRDSLYPSETQTVRLWGTIGNNSGYTFKGLEVIRNGTAIDITAWNNLDIPCGEKTRDTVLSLNAYPYNITPPLTQGNNTVTIHGPQGGTIVKTFFVR
mgnify:CR=1 FL=1